jgi:DNA-binding MarR family transcriptional regulator
LKQLDLTFPLARASDPLTSHQAADRVVQSGRIYTQRAEILRVVREAPGSTASEIARALGQTSNHIASRRLPELEDEGFVRRGEARTCRATSYKAVSWFPVKENT